MADEPDPAAAPEIVTEAVREALREFEGKLLESQRRADQQIEGPDVSPELRPVMERLGRVVQRLDAIDDRLASMDKKLDAVQAPQRGPFGSGGPVLAPEYMQGAAEPEAALSAARLSSELAAQKKVTEELQERLAEKSEKSSVFRPKQLFQQFAEEVGEAAEDEATEFAIDDVEVVVTGLLGADDQGAMAMGFNMEDQLRPETATQLKFKLRRKSKTRIVK